MESTSINYAPQLSFANENKFWKATFKLFLLFLNKTNLSNEILLTLNENNSELKVNVGENIKIELPEQNENDYSWKIDGSIPNEIELLFDNYKTTQSKLSGKSGKRSVEFITKEPGIVDVKLNYCKIGQADQSIKNQFVMKLFIE